jgi:amidohydrolase
MNSILDQAREIFPYTQKLRRDFHKHPELGFQETRTAEVINQELSQLEGFTIQSGIAETGVVGILNEEKPGKNILLRFDMDALPIQENTGVEYASINEGIMHACGHDGHMAIGLSIARILHENRHDLPGSIKFVFQPAEEGLGGAKMMVEEGVLTNPKPDLALALHLWNIKPVGWFGISDGPMMSASDTFYIRLKGKGGHGAAPHLAVDPIVAAAGIVNTLQSLISREVNTLDSGVVTVGTIQGGEAHNVIPEEVNLSGTIRSFTEQTRDQLLKRLEEVVEKTAHAYQCQVEISIEEVAPAVSNHPDVAETLRKIAADLFPQSTIDSSYRTMVSEDMAYFMENIPGCFCLIGSANPDLGLDAMHHQPEFNFDEDAMTQGVGLLVSGVYQLLND